MRLSKVYKKEKEEKKEEEGEQEELSEKQESWEKIWIKEEMGGFKGGKEGGY